MLGLCGPELIIILVIIILLFGASRITGIATALGGSINAFRKAVKDEDTEKKDNHLFPISVFSVVVNFPRGGTRT